MKNVWVSYLPEGEWRGALEGKRDGFVGYPTDQDFFGAAIDSVEESGGTVRVVLKGEDDRLRHVMFQDVVSVVRHAGAGDQRVRFLSEWKMEPPHRRFVFDSADQHSVPLLEITTMSTSVDD